MAAAGRNDPCPCGSGKKYKHCCLRAGSPPGLSVLGSEVRSAATEEPAWQADIVPMPMRFEEAPTARPGMVLVTAGGFVVETDVLERPSPEPEDMARELFHALKRARSFAGDWPERVEVRFEALVEPLSDLLSSTGVSVVARRALPGLDEAAASVSKEVGGVEDSLRVSSPETWAGWGLPGDWIAETFEAAAALYRARPWEHLTDSDWLEVAVPGAGEWIATVMGAGGETWGVSFYELEEDLLALFDLGGEVPETQGGRTLSMLYHRHDELAPAMRREIRKAGWEVAGPTAYPRILTIGSPAGGLTRADARVITDGMNAIAGFGRDLEDLSEATQGVVEWRDEGSGVTIAWRPYRWSEGDWEGAEEEWTAETLWEAPERLAPGDARGPGAEPEARLETFEATMEELQAFGSKEMEYVDRFRDWLSARFSDSTVEKHAANAEELVYFLVERSGAPVRAVHELDLREFLYDWYPRKVTAPKAFTRSLPVSLDRFFVFLDEEEGIRCPWAAEVLGERDAISARLDDPSDGGLWGDGAYWNQLLWDDFEARVMTPEETLGDGEEWGPLMGIEEAGLLRELGHRWLLWRDETIRSGEDDPEAVRAICARRQHAWETTPHDRLDGRTPMDVILEEREKRRRR